LQPFPDAYRPIGCAQAVLEEKADKARKAAEKKAPKA